MTTWKEILTADLVASSDTAAEFMRASLEFDDPQFLALALQRVLAARGSLADLPLSAQEWAALVEALAQQPLQQAA